ncbi:hypothetical protein [Thiothrix nivea]|nr:hypothetical protein [Thiothrix nivea]
MLVDTSVWIDHLRAKEERLERLLLQNKRLHGIASELGCGWQESH